MPTLLKDPPVRTILAGSALYLLTKAPSHIQQPILRRLYEVLSPQRVAQLVTGLKWLFGLGLATNANKLLSLWAGNGFQLFSSTKGWEWDKEIAVVTGGSSGFGALFARDLSAKGIHIVVLDVQELPPHLQNNKKISFFKCDVTDAAAVKEVAKVVQSTIGSPSILINNAGIGSGKNILDTPSEYLKKIYGVNIFSHWHTVQAFLPDMIVKRKGHVISIASMASFVSMPWIVDYCCTKAAALSFHEGLRAELRTIHGCPEIKTTIIHPIWADTPLIAPSKAQVKAAGQEIIDPQRVSDAVVDQVMRCRSGQILIGKHCGLLSTLRGLPTWLSEGLRRSQEAPLDIEGLGVEK